MKPNYPFTEKELRDSIENFSIRISSLFGKTIFDNARVIETSEDFILQMFTDETIITPEDKTILVSLDFVDHLNQLNTGNVIPVNQEIVFTPEETILLLTLEKRVTL